MILDDDKTIVQKAKQDAEREIKLRKLAGQLVEAANYIHRKQSVTSSNFVVCSSKVVTKLQTT